MVAEPGPASRVRPVRRPARSFTNCQRSAAQGAGRGGQRLPRCHGRIQRREARSRLDWILPRQKPQAQRKNAGGSSILLPDDGCRPRILVPEFSEFAPRSWSGQVSEAPLAVVEAMGIQAAEACEVVHSAGRPCDLECRRTVASSLGDSREGGDRAMVSGYEEISKYRR